MSIDGVDVRDVALADLARVVGVVSQETYLLHTTVRENLRYARPEATDAEIESAARAAQVHDVIAALPDGYETMVGSRGHRFSGGERQRIAIARTLLRDPAILVLDEATSALDTETERAVQAAFESLAAGRTTITIAHRLSTVRDADQIAVLDHGRIVETGTHDGLLAADGSLRRPRGLADGGCAESRHEVPDLREVLGVDPPGADRLADQVEAISGAHVRRSPESGKQNVVRSSTASFRRRCADPHRVGETMTRSIGARI